ncbi:MAG: hypothetical protein KGH84_01945 [Paracoccaceae bacterium]|nr:hypothetical protein [Paracoccaceae bacterium]
MPVFDGTNLAQNIQQVQQMIADADRQVQQIQQLENQLATLKSQLTNLQGILGSMTGLNQIFKLYTSAQDLLSRAQKLTDVRGLVSSLSVGNFSIQSLLANGGSFTMGSKSAVSYITGALAQGGFTQSTLQTLGTSANPKDQAVATTAATSAATMAASQAGYDEANQSLGRIDGLVQQIGQTTTLKESVDLNTRMAAEGNYELISMMRMMAASGIAQGQSGIGSAADMAAQRAQENFGGN